MTKSKKLALIATTCVIAIVSSSAKAESTLAFTGGSATGDSYYGYVGGVTALNYDLSRDGWLMRATAAYGSYKYDRSGLPKVDGDVSAQDVMIGYQKYFGGNSLYKNLRLTGYLGGDYQDHSISPNDTKNPVRGSTGGVKGQAEIFANLDNKISVSAIGNYSSAFDTYWSKGSVGYNFGHFTFGPEVLFMGSESYDQQRFGVFIGDIPLFSSVKAGVSGGYSHASRQGDSSGYG
ncbi:MAG: cellulose biosynthesis protein BcsS, partial [Pseudomonadota bacterium]